MIFVHVILQRLAFIRLCLPFDKLCFVHVHGHEKSLKLGGVKIVNLNKQRDWRFDCENNFVNKK